MLLAVLTTVVALSVVPPPPDGRVNKDMWNRVVPLVLDLESPDGAKREQSKAALLALGPQATEGLLFMAKRGPPALQEGISRLLPEFGPGAIRTLERTGASDNQGHGSTPTMWRMAKAAVISMGAPALDELEAMVPNQWSGSFALSVLREMPPDLSLPVLLRLAKHPNPETRNWVVSVVGRIDRSGAADALLVATGDSDIGVRRKAWEGLGRMKDRRALPILREQMRSNAWETVLVAPGSIYAFDLLFEFAAAARNPRAPRSRTTKTAEEDHVRSAEEDHVRGAAVLTLFRAGDAVSRGVGARYQSPKGQGTWLIQLWYGLLALWSTAAMIAAWGFVGADQFLRRRHLIAMGALAFFGFLWGWLPTGISGGVEVLLLLVAVPFAVAISALTGPQPGLALKLLPPVFWAFLAVVVYIPASFFVMLLTYEVKVELLPHWLFVDPATAASGALVIAVLHVVRKLARENWEAPRFGGSPAFRSTCLSGAATFYAGYFVGQTALWGGSLEWLKLWLPARLT